ncbi:hypothetical protein [Streptomyces sp. NPDC055085]
MGWNSANEIFDPVARALVDTGADDHSKRKVLGDLIGRLQDGGWETEDASLEIFLSQPAIVQAFADKGVHLPDGRCCFREPGVDARTLLVRRLADADLSERSAVYHVDAFARQLADQIRADVELRQDEGQEALAEYGRRLAGLITPQSEHSLDW